MITVKSISEAIIILIRAGAATRGAYCFFKMLQNDEDVALYKKRFINTLVFYVLAELVWQLKELAVYYYG
ncbi:MAG: mercury transporter [Firmicutes bacterium HGW-Firmicutes-7]|nr:MAG: mercury transporter [Firmicutes bacterium HGW-Firmicutes-7]